MAELTYISGLKELNELLQQLPANIEKNVMRGAVRAGSVVFMDKAKENAPVQDGDLKKSIKVKTRSKRGKVSATVQAGDKKAFYAHMVEFGTASYYEGSGNKSKKQPYKINSKSGKNSLKYGNVYAKSVTHKGNRPQPFMRTALDAGQVDAIQAVADYILNRLPTEIKKLK